MQLWVRQYCTRISNVGSEQVRDLGGPVKEGVLMGLRNIVPPMVGSLFSWKSLFTKRRTSDDCLGVYTLVWIVI